MNFPYEMILTIQMHLNCRKDRVQSPTRKEGQDLFRRTSDASSRNNPRTKNNMMILSKEEETSDTVQLCDTVE